MSMSKLAAMISETVNEAGPAGVPSGHVYAALALFIDLNTYTALISTLLDLGEIRKEGDLLRPKK